MQGRFHAVINQKVTTSIRDVEGVLVADLILSQGHVISCIEEVAETRDRTEEILVLRFGSGSTGSVIVPAGSFSLVETVERDDPPPARDPYV